MRSYLGPVFGDYAVLMLKIPGELAYPRVALRRLRLQRAVEDFLQFRCDLRIGLAGWNRRLQQPQIHNRERIVTGKRRGARQDFIQNHAERVDVASGIAAFSAHLFGRNVIRRAHHLG